MLKYGRPRLICRRHQGFHWFITLAHHHLSVMKNAHVQLCKKDLRQHSRRAGLPRRMKTEHLLYQGEGTVDLFANSSCWLRWRSIDFNLLQRLESAPRKLYLGTQNSTPIRLHGAMRLATHFVPWIVWKNMQKRSSLCMQILKHV